MDIPKIAMDEAAFRKAHELDRMAKDKLEKILTEWREQREEKEVVVTEDDMMHIVSKWTGVPLNRMEQKETQKLLTMENELRGRVIGQDRAERVKVTGPPGLQVGRGNVSGRVGHRESLPSLAAELRTPWPCPRPPELCARRTPARP